VVVTEKLKELCPHKRSSSY